MEEELFSELLRELVIRVITVRNLGSKLWVDGKYVIEVGKF